MDTSFLHRCDVSSKNIVKIQIACFAVVIFDWFLLFDENKLRPEAHAVSMVAGQFRCIIFLAHSQNIFLAVSQKQKKKVKFVQNFQPLFLHANYVRNPNKNWRPGRTKQFHPRKAEFWSIIVRKEIFLFFWGEPVLRWEWRHPHANSPMQRYAKRGERHNCECILVTKSGNTSSCKRACHSFQPNAFACPAFLSPFDVVHKCAWRVVLGSMLQGAAVENMIPGMHTFAAQTVRHSSSTISHTGQPDAQMQPDPSPDNLAPGDAATVTHIYDVVTCRYNQVEMQTTKHNRYQPEHATKAMVDQDGTAPALERNLPLCANTCNYCSSLCCLRQQQCGLLLVDMAGGTQDNIWH